MTAHRLYLTFSRAAPAPPLGLAGSELSPRPTRATGRLSLLRGAPLLASGRAGLVHNRPLLCRVDFARVLVVSAARQGVGGLSPQRSSSSSLPSASSASSSPSPSSSSPSSSSPPSSPSSPDRSSTAAFVASPRSKEGQKKTVGSSSSSPPPAPSSRFKTPTWHAPLVLDDLDDIPGLRTRTPKEDEEVDESGSSAPESGGGVHLRTFGKGGSAVSAESNVAKVAAEASPLLDLPSQADIRTSVDKNVRVDSDDDDDHAVAAAAAPAVAAASVAGETSAASAGEGAGNEAKAGTVPALASYVLRFGTSSLPSSSLLGAKASVHVAIIGESGEAISARVYAGTGRGRGVAGGKETGRGKKGAIGGGNSGPVGPKAGGKEEEAVEGEGWVLPGNAVFSSSGEDSFQAGRTAVVSLRGPDVRPVAALWVAPDGDTWRLVEASLAVVGPKQPQVEDDEEDEEVASTEEGGVVAAAAVTVPKAATAAATVAAPAPAAVPKIGAPVSGVQVGSLVSSSEEKMREVGSVASARKNEANTARDGSPSGMKGTQSSGLKGTVFEEVEEGVEEEKEGPLLAGSLRLMDEANMIEMEIERERAREEVRQKAEERRMQEIRERERAEKGGQEIGTLYIFQPDESELLGDSGDALAVEFRPLKAGPLRERDFLDVLRGSSLLASADKAAVKSLEAQLALESERRRLEGMDEYEGLKRWLLAVTSLIVAVGTVTATLLGGDSVGAAFAAGGLASLLFLFRLQSRVDNLVEDAAVAKGLRTETAARAAAALAEVEGPGTVVLPTMAADAARRDGNRPGPSWLSLEGLAAQLLSMLPKKVQVALADWVSGGDVGSAGGDATAAARRREAFLRVASVAVMVGVAAYVMNRGVTGGGFYLHPAEVLAATLGFLTHKIPVLLAAMRRDVPRL